MLFKKRLTIIPDIVPETDADICHGIAAYCAEQGLPYEFVSRTTPVTAIVDGCKYTFTKYLTRRSLATFWVLRGKAE